MKLSSVVDSRLQARAQRLLAREIPFIDNPAFRRRNAVREIRDSNLVGPPLTGRSHRPPEWTPAYFVRLYETPLLTAEVERALFRKFNYLKFRANQLRAALDLVRPDADTVAEIESRLAEAAEVRDRIITANLRLVVSIARRFVNENNDFDELVSDGNLTLISAVEKFDHARGFRFSTYATHAIQREFYRKIRRKRIDQARYVRGLDGLIADAPDNESDAPAVEKTLRYRQLAELIAKELDEREQLVLAKRFGLDEEGPQTLRVIGMELGVSKERVRQLEIRAIAALQRVATGALPL